MTTASLKMKLEKSLEVFAIGIFLSTLLLFITVVLDMNYWVFCFLPSLFLFSSIGAGIVTKALVSFTRLKGKPIVNNPEEFEEKFAGSNGVNSMFWVIIVIIAILIYLFSYVSGVNLISFKTNIYYIILFVFDIVLLIWGMYNIISQLSFVIFFISVIPTMYTKESTENKFFKKLNQVDLNTYDHEKNLQKLLTKYNERILWLENHMTEDKEVEYKAKIAIYEICLRDIADILNGLDV